MYMFQCEHLTKKLDQYILKDVSFAIEPGTVLGVIGVNGVGKTTLMRALVGSYRLDRCSEDGGELFLEGKHFCRDMKEYKSSIAYVLQECPFSLNMTAVEVGERYGYYYKGFDRQKYMELIKKYEVPEKKMWLSTLSKGQLIRMQLAFAQSYPAKLYIMDEPVGNLDAEFRDDFYDTIRSLVEDEQSSVILSSHLVTELEHIADQILWIGRNENIGFLRYFGEIDELKERYRILSADKEAEAVLSKDMIAGSRIRETHSEYLLYREDGKFAERISAECGGEWRFPDLQEIMYYTEKESAQK